MAVAVIFGLAFATVLTLVMVPTLYSIVEDVRVFIRRQLTRLSRRSGGGQSGPSVPGGI
jgi:HAE1 family hydrophobic/amphiphilic exporter-1